MNHPMDRELPSSIHYRPSAGEIVEWGDVRGCAVALPTHFHDEDQVTIVLAGRRRFRVGGTLVVLGPGEGVGFAAGTPHGSLDEPEGVVCRNAYLPAGLYALPDLVAAMARLCRQHGRLDEPAVLALLRQHRIASTTAPRHHPRVAGSVAEAARRAGLSREGYSRAFHRSHGLPPRTFGVLARLNAARALLRAGEAPAAVAAETGFADQSHLGRGFRQAFGVTPGQYRARITSVPDGRCEQRYV